MGYPCAVGIAALAIVRGAGEAADHGIIMRTGEAFQTFRTLTHVLLDKTGTLTLGPLIPVGGIGVDCVRYPHRVSAKEEDRGHRCGGPRVTGAPGTTPNAPVTTPILPPERVWA